MAIVTLANVRHAYGTHVVLDGVTMAIERGEKVGLIGRNGAGKTTLMRILRADLSPDSGSVTFQRGARVGYLSQDPDFREGDTVRDVAARAFEALLDLHKAMEALWVEMGDAEGAALERMLRRQSEIEAGIEAAGGYVVDHRIDAMLHGLGFTDEQFGQPAESLSGGEKGRLSLARLLLEAPDLLLLDEPTNHLDIAGCQWLESFLADDYPGAVLLVSHDRWLLDRVVTRIVELERACVFEYPGNYSAFVTQRDQRRLTELRVFEKQQDHVRREEEYIRRNKAGQRSKQARGRESRLDRFRDSELVERPIDLSVMNLRLPKAPRSGDLVAKSEGLGKAYGDRTLFSDVDIVVSRGDRIAVIGPNGAGKTTLVRCLLGEMTPDSGETRLGTMLRPGYYRQSHDHIDMSLTVWEYLQGAMVGLDGAPGVGEQQARDLAGAFLFSGADQDKVLGDASGGERSRAALAGLVASGCNLLVLDEPTNHLDIPSAERLERALSREGGYEGTLLLVSHDRALIQSTCERLIVLDGAGGVRLFDGRLSEWLEKGQRAGQQSETTDQAPAKPATRRTGQNAQKQAGNRNGDSGGSSRSGGKKRGGSASKRRRGAGAGDTGSQQGGLSQRKLDERIAALTELLTELDMQLVDPAVFTDGERCRAVQAERTAAAEELRSHEEEWLRRAEAEG